MGQKVKADEKRTPVDEAKVELKLALEGACMSGQPSRYSLSPRLFERNS